MRSTLDRCMARHLGLCCLRLQIRIFFEELPGSLGLLRLGSITSFNLPHSIEAVSIPPMSPSHANKKGVRYRYYVSHALLQNRKANAGSIARRLAAALPQHDNFRAHLDPVEKIDDVPVGHADAARRHGGADRVGLIRPMNAIHA